MRLPSLARGRQIRRVVASHSQAFFKVDIAPKLDLDLFGPDSTRSSIIKQPLNRKAFLIRTSALLNRTLVRSKRIETEFSTDNDFDI